MSSLPRLKSLFRKIVTTAIATKTKRKERPIVFLFNDNFSKENNKKIIPSTAPTRNARFNITSEIASTEESKAKLMMNGYRLK